MSEIDPEWNPDFDWVAAQYSWESDVEPIVDPEWAQRSLEAPTEVHMNDDPLTGALVVTGYDRPVEEPGGSLHWAPDDAVLHQAAIDSEEDPVPYRGPGSANSEGVV